MLRGPATGDFSAIGGSLLIRDSDIRARSFGSEPAASRRLAGPISLVKQVATDVGLLARSESVGSGPAGDLPHRSDHHVPPGTYTVHATGDRRFPGYIAEDLCSPAAH